MADRGTVVLQSTSLEGNAVISIRGFVPLGQAFVQPCSLPAPTSEENDEWYGDPTVGAHQFIEYLLFPVLSAGTQDATGTPLNVFDTELPRTITLQKQNTSGPDNIYVQEQFFYLECTGWNDASLKITRTDGDVDFPFAITYSTIGTTREASTGLLYDYAGAPNLLCGPLGSITTPTAYPPTRDGEVIANTGSLVIGQFVTIAPPLRGKAIYFQVTDQSTPGGITFAEFQIELV